MAHFERRGCVRGRREHIDGKAGGGKALLQERGKPLIVFDQQQSHAYSVHAISRQRQRFQCCGAVAGAPGPSGGRWGQGTSDRVELPGDVVGDAPEIADIGLPDEDVGSPLMPPVKQVDVLPAVEGRLHVRLFRRADDQGQRADRLVVGGIDELRRRAARRRPRDGRRGR